MRPLTAGLLTAASAAACADSTSGSDAFGAQSACERAITQRVTAGTHFAFDDESIHGATGTTYRVAGRADWSTRLGTTFDRRWSCTATKDGAVYHVTVRFTD